MESAQSELLLDIVRRNAHTEFGASHSFPKIDTVDAFQSAVPISSYEDLLPYIEKAAAGAKHVLTADDVQRFGLTSGSTHASKLIPYTQSLLSEFRSGIDPWVFRLMKNHPRLMRGRSYWSVTPVGEKLGRTTGGIPVGFDDERMYFNSFVQWVLRNVMIAPSELALVQDIDAFKYATLRLLLQEKNITWISVWNPTFLKLLLQPLEDSYDRLAEDVRRGTMSADLRVEFGVDRRIRSRLISSPRRSEEMLRERLLREGDISASDARGRTIYESLWPRLELISCWAHGNAKNSLHEITKLFPRATIEPKGLVATEAFVSYPYSGDTSALSLLSHFFEFESESGEVALAHQLSIGKFYSVIVTTGGGLYRYRMNDVVEVCGFVRGCPLVRFIGRQNNVVDLFGEKLNERFVRSVVERELERRSIPVDFWMLAPDRMASHPGFTLFIQCGAAMHEGMIGGLGKRIDELLSESYHYRYCRRLGQLSSCKVFVIVPTCDPHAVYLEACSHNGQRLGDIKETALHAYQGWAALFKGAYI